MDVVTHTNIVILNISHSLLFFLNLLFILSGCSGFFQYFSYIHYLKNFFYYIVNGCSYTSINFFSLFFIKKKQLVVLF